MLPTDVQSIMFVVVTVATGLKVEGYAANTERGSSLGRPHSHSP